MLGLICVAKGIKERAANKRRQASSNANVCQLLETYHWGLQIEAEEPENITQDKDAGDAHAESTNERIINLYSALTDADDVSAAATAAAKPLLDILVWINVRLLDIWLVQVDVDDPVQTVENF